MESRHLCSLLSSVTLLLVCYVSANPAVPFAKDPIIQDTCPVTVQVGEGYSLAHVTLQDKLLFRLNPNTPRMLMRFLGNDNVMFAATVDGTMVKLIRCNAEGSQCTVEEEEATKSSDILDTNRWNTIKVNYYNGKLTVDINFESRVMSSHRKTTKGPVIVGGQVTFLVPADSYKYEATLKILCHDSEIPPAIQTEIPPLTTTIATPTTQSLYSAAPYEECPVYQVEVNHPSIPAILHDNLTLAVFPTHPNLMIKIYDASPSGRRYITVHVHDHTAKLRECPQRGGEEGCVLIQSINTVDSIMIPEEWNHVTLSYDGDKVTVNINENKRLLTARISKHNQQAFEVVAEAPRDVYPKLGEHYVAYVNVDCDVVEQKRLWPTPPTPRKSTPSTPRWPTIPTLTTDQVLPTKSPIVEVTTEPPTTTGVSRDIAIVVGVLVGILAIIALVIIISTIKKRRSAAITERAPLQNQFQQQQG